MLEFSDAPYQFFPPRPLGVVQAIGPHLNRLLLATGRHRVREIGITGELDRVRDVDPTRTRILFVANHPTRSDPQFMVEIQRRLGIPACFMAAYDVFLEGRLQAWFMQRTGSFSIDREGRDRKAMATAIETLQKGELALTIFPEGNVYLMNDRVTPFLEGTAFIASKAQQALEGGGDVLIVPVSIKYSHLRDVRQRVHGRLERLARETGFDDGLDPENPGEGVVSVGSHLLSRLLEGRSEIPGERDFRGKDPGEIQAGLFALAKELIGGLEEELALPRNDEVFVVDRIRKVRAAVHQIRIDEETLNEVGEEKASELARRAMLGFRILAYVLPYFNERPSLDRYSETVERLCEDYYSRCLPSLGPRRAMARIGTPISVRERLDEEGGRTRAVVSSLTRQMEEAVADGVRAINESNDSPGSSLIVET